MGSVESGRNGQGQDSNVRDNRTTEPTALVGNVGYTGGSEAHANNQPAIGAYYIMYIP